MHLNIHGAHLLEYNFVDASNELFAISSLLSKILNVRTNYMLMFSLHSLAYLQTWYLKEVNFPCLSFLNLNFLTGCW